MQSSGAEAALVLVMILVVFVYPALALGRIAGRLGKSPRRYGLLALVPLGSLVALGLLAFGEAAPRGQAVRGRA